MPPHSNSPYRLLVEGVDDRHSTIHLLHRHGYDWDNETTVRPYIRETGGLQELLKELPVTLKGPYQRVGALLDANTHLSDRWSQLRGYVNQAGLTLPDAPHHNGTIISGLRSGSLVGFWLMPDNSSPGNLEHFLQKLVPEDDQTWSWANDVVHEARQRGARCRPVDHLKSALHTWLAWQEEPGLPFGTALRAQVFRHDTEDALRFVAWFKRLFVDA
jgi:hypothetical protein